MENFWQGIYENKALWSVVLSALAAQGIKIVLGFIKHRKFNFYWVLGTGGMPSAHSAAVVSLVVVFVWFNYKNKIGDIGFYVLFAVSITSSVQLIGVYLVFASLIMPALAAAKYQTKPALFLAGLIGISGYLSGAGRTE